MKEKAEKTIGGVKGLYSDTEAMAKTLLKDARHKAKDLRKEAAHHLSAVWGDARRLFS